MSSESPTLGVCLVENRVLEGPNLYFTRQAIKATVELAPWLRAPSERLDGAFEALGARRARAGEPGSAERERAVMRLAEVATRIVARESGTDRLGIRVRHGETPTQFVIAFPWNRRGRGRALARAVAALLADLLEPITTPGAIQRAVSDVQETEPGPRETLAAPTVPVISITGTNGKTTTTRLVAHIAMTAGRKTAWSSTDGVLVMGEHVEEGDYSGPAGARAVLATPGLEIGVLETARGGLLNRGMGVPCNDVSVVTNVTPDHLGSNGINTVDQLAEVKAIITKVTRPDGWCVLNGDDPRVWAMRVGTPARLVAFTLDPDSPCIREVRAARGKAYTIIDNHIACIEDGGVDMLVDLDDVPMTLAGLSVHNVANALAGAAGALALGLPRSAVVAGLRTFAPDATLNPGRMNVYTVALPHDPDAHATVIIDMAHNEGGLEALLTVGRGLVAPGARLLLGLGTGGDRTDEILTRLGEMAGQGADLIHVVHKEHYLRGRTMEDLESHLREGLSHVGAHAEASHETEMEGLLALLGVAHDGDVIALMTHSHQALLHAWLMEHDGRMDTAGDIRGKARIARGLEGEEDVVIPVAARSDVAMAIDALDRATLAADAPASLTEIADTLRALLGDAHQDDTTSPRS